MLFFTREWYSVNMNVDVILPCWSLYVAQCSNLCLNATYCPMYPVDFGTYLMENIIVYYSDHNDYNLRKGFASHL